MDGQSCCGPERKQASTAQFGELPPELKYADGTPPPSPCCLPTYAANHSGSTDGMLLMSGGSFTMGTDNPGWANAGDGESPARTVHVKPFWITPTTITNKDFQEFINETAYKTEADKFGWSFVFHALLTPKQLQSKEVEAVPGLAWWYKVDRANWRRPEGSGTNIKKRMDHPVVHVSWLDAYNYCQWKGWRLPTEAEWEFAAKGGVDDQQWWWGEDLEPSGKHAMNVWQGNFPHENSLADGYLGTAPAKHYKPNKFGLYNVTGNVWEWVHDWFSPDFHHSSDYQANDPLGPPAGSAKVMKGGSFLCHHSYCNRYRLPARTANTPDSAASNNGFRAVRDATDEEIERLGSD